LLSQTERISSALTASECMQKRILVPSKGDYPIPNKPVSCSHYQTDYYSASRNQFSISQRRRSAVIV
jgi:hypothetical protein